MIRMLRKRFALSDQGAKDMIKAIIASACLNIALILPAGALAFLIKELLGGKLSSPLLYIFMCLVCLIVIWFAAGFDYDSSYFATYKESGVRRVNLAERLRKLPLSFFGKRDLADLTATIMSDSAVLEKTCSHFVPKLYGAIISTILISVGLIIYKPAMALATLWVVPVAFLIVALSSRIQKRVNRINLKTNVACMDGIQECVETVRDLQSCNAEHRYLEGLRLKIDAVEKRAIVSEFVVAAFVVSASLVLKLGIATTALTGAALLIKGRLDALTYFMFLLVASRFYDPMLGALQNLAAVISSHANVERMNELNDQPIQEGETALNNEGFDICFENVSFSYDADTPVLQNVSFTARQSEITALIGPSGGGKTTVSRLAARFWDIDSGKITVGGMDISKIDPETLMSLYSIVFQDVTLFDNSVMENIRIGKKDASDEQVLEAAKLANVDEFALKLPNGYDTFIGENGCRLSGGERQRISIARAFLKDAPIILLDEATASLDVENETLIQSALMRLIKSKTVLLIAHRMRTVSGADKIVVIKDGGVKEQGAPKALLSQNGVYSEMVKLQSSAR